MKKFLKTVFLGFFLCFFKILTPYLMVLGKYLVGCTCREKCKYFEINLNGESFFVKDFCIKIKKRTGELFFNF